MDFKLENINETVLSLARKIGYKPIGVDADNEYNLVRPLGRDNYPRFHIYVKKNDEGDIFSISLHLDQKKPSYKESAAHSGEYKGEIVEKEAERIKIIINQLK